MILKKLRNMSYYGFVFLQLFYFFNEWLFLSIYFDGMNFWDDGVYNVNMLISYFRGLILQDGVYFSYFIVI